MLLIKVKVKVVAFILVLFDKVIVPVGQGCICATHRSQGPGRSQLHRCFLSWLRSQEVVLILLSANAERLIGLPYIGFFFDKYKKG